MSAPYFFAKAAVVAAACGNQVKIVISSVEYALLRGRKGKIGIYHFIYSFF